MARMLAPQPHTAAPGYTSTHGGWLPTSILTEQVQRLALSAAVGGGLWTFGLVMDAIVRPRTLGAPIAEKSVTIEFLAIVASALMWLYVRLSKQSAQVKVHAALAYFVVNALGVALLTDWMRPPAISFTGLFTWNPVVILVGAMIIPAAPSRMLAAALVAATTDPLAAWYAHLQGATVPGLLDTFVLFMPNYACAAVAVIPASVLRRLGRSLRQAQDMGSYHLEELLGRGGMGEVWRASHRLLARGAAVKLVRPELIGAATQLEAEDMVRRFTREAQATAALNSPHTIRLYDFGVTDEHTFYYVMELLAGRDLESLVRASGPLPAERVLFLLRQVCHSLAEAHAQGLVHRDITPANVYVCRMGLDYDFVKVLDFGLVSFSDRRGVGNSLMTGVHTTIGTPAFMAPEVILHSAVDPRSDIYALGCVAYFLLTGKPVFHADSAMKMFVQHLENEPVAPSGRSALPIPRELDALVLACLQKEPEKRPQTVEELRDRLDQIVTARTWTSADAREWWREHFFDIAPSAFTDFSLRTTAVAVS